MTIRKEPSDSCFGFYHPTAQIISICDLDKGGTFKGKSFEMKISKSQARKYIKMTEKLKPEHRAKIDMSLMNDENFAKEIMEMCK